MGLTQIQTEIYKAIEQLSEKASFTEFILAKKVRENNKIDGKKKAGISLADLQVAVEALEEKQIFYSLHVNSVNEILIKKEESSSELDLDAKKRRQSSEKSMAILTSADLKGNSSKGKKPQKRNERKSIRINDNFEDWE